MNIQELLAQGKKVKFTLDGGEEEHEVDMAPPAAATAKDIRSKFLALSATASKLPRDGKKGVLSDKQSDIIKDLSARMEAVNAELVKACFPEGSAESQLEEDVVRQFVLRTGGDSSPVLAYAREVCGIPVGEAEQDDKSLSPEEQTDFS